MVTSLICLIFLNSGYSLLHKITKISITLLYSFLSKSFLSIMLFKPLQYSEESKFLIRSSLFDGNPTFTNLGAEISIHTSQLMIKLSK